MLTRMGIGTEYSGQYSLQPCWCRGSSQTPVSATGANAVKRPKTDDNWFTNNLHAWGLPTGRASSQVALLSAVPSRVCHVLLELRATTCVALFLCVGYGYLYRGLGDDYCD